MKRSFITFAVFGIISAFSVSAFAQKIGTVDGNKILDGYSEYQAANKKIQDVVKSWSDTVGMMQKNLKDKFESYQKIKETMSKDALAKADEELGKMQQDLQAYQAAKTNQQNGGELGKLQKELLTPILEKVKAAIGTVAKKKKIEVVFDKNAQTTYVDAGVPDLSDDVIAALKK